MTTTPISDPDFFLELLTAACAGIALGSLYFGGLWLSVRRAPHWQHPGLGMAASLFLRLALVGLGLYWLADGHWQRYAAALPGLLLARWWWVRHIQTGKAES
ncbi:ATP synthase subunit I [Methylomonas methanica]|uniref:F1/F0 ATPase, Methanosarcina type, subunit 2 n=1 Tax=Methylomonas methanica (strain DSM 25384 / MC09) TaxID=857087 RepID=G0A2D1_METMM|nr:ATP synthase subunit I [Methylomonas methanica]AEF98943.1 F1/F0 ATPase, Methanosarcina type, subunit 2 [Methylomonas methanica MC09]